MTTYSKTSCRAHDANGYDSRFILNYMDRKKLSPKTSSANGGAHIQQASTRSCTMKFIDSLQALEALPDTYDIKQIVKQIYPTRYHG